MRDLNSSSTSDNSSRDSCIPSGGALGKGLSDTVVAALVGVAEVVVGCVVGEDWWLEDVGWSVGDWSEVGVAEVCADEPFHSRRVSAPFSFAKILLRVCGRADAHWGDWDCSVVVVEACGVDADAES